MTTTMKLSELGVRHQPGMFYFARRGSNGRRELHEALSLREAAQSHVVATLPSDMAHMLVSVNRHGILKATPTIPGGKKRRSSRVKHRRPKMLGAKHTKRRRR